MIENDTVRRSQGINQGFSQSQTLRNQRLDNRAKAIVPMTIAMALHHCQSDSKLIDNQPFENVSLVARLIESIAIPGRFTFEVNDDTGTMGVLVPTQGSSRPAYLDKLKATLNRYVRLVVTPKLTGESHNELIFYLNRIEDCPDLNVITSHLIEVILRHLQRQQGFTA